MGQSPTIWRMTIDRLQSQQHDVDHYNIYTRSQPPPPVAELVHKPNFGCSLELLSSFLRRCSLPEETQQNTHRRPPSRGCKPRSKVQRFTRRWEPDGYHTKLSISPQFFTTRWSRWHSEALETRRLWFALSFDPHITSRSIRRCFFYAASASISPFWSDIRVPNLVAWGMAYTYYSSVTIAGVPRIFHFKFVAIRTYYMHIMHEYTTNIFKRLLLSKQHYLIYYVRQCNGRK